MQKKIILTICLIIVSCLLMKAQDNGIGTVALHHHGNVTIHWGNRIQEAIDAAVQGDTLYLSEGLFTGFSVRRGIVILGSGVNTIIAANVDIPRNYDSDAPYENCVFSGLNINGDFVVSQPVNGFRMSQCQLNNLFIRGVAVEQSAISMSYIKEHLYLGEPLQSLEVTNSKILQVDGGGATTNAATFYNCNVRSNIYDHAERNTFYNCIINQATTATIINCVYEFCNGLITDSWNASWDTWSDQWVAWENGMNSPFSDEEMLSNGWVGVDGVVAGITGGTHPYTLDPLTPHVVEHQVDVDHVNKNLKVSLKMNE